MTRLAARRLNLLRAGYLLVAVGLAITIWPRVFSHSLDWPLMNSVVASLLAALSLLAFLGLWRPLQMLPVLLFDVLWKVIWLLAVALPLWRAGSLGEDAMQTVTDCATAVVLLVTIPWDYVVSRYLFPRAVPAPAPAPDAPA